MKTQTDHHEVVETLISTIIVDTRLQWRAKGIDKPTVREYKGYLADDTNFNMHPIVVYELPIEGEDNETGFFVIDGFHRIMAYAEAGRVVIPAHIHLNKTWHEAQREAARLNIKHDQGLRLDNPSKRAILGYMVQKDWHQFTLKAIARELGVRSQTTITNWLHQLRADGVDAVLSEQVMGLDGTLQPRHAPPHPNGFKPKNPQTAKAKRKGKPLPVVVPPPLPPSEHVGDMTFRDGSTVEVFSQSPDLKGQPAEEELQSDHIIFLHDASEEVKHLFVESFGYEVDPDIPPKGALKFSHQDRSWKRISRHGTEALQNLLFFIQRMNQSEAPIEERHLLKLMLDLDAITEVVSGVRSYLKGLVKK